MKDLKELTKAEDQVMQILWKLQRGFVKDVIEAMPEPKACVQYGIHHYQNPGDQRICRSQSLRKNT